MQYQEYDLKAEQTIVDYDNHTVEIVLSREDSYQRLLELNAQFGKVAPSTEIQQLYKALSLLSVDKRYLFEQLYFQERELAAQFHLSQNAINKCRQRILEKL